MNRPNYLTEYITISPMSVTGGPLGDLLLLRLLSVLTLTPRNPATVFAEATALLRREPLHFF
jgi:hypothetical protein